jgi:hypothetical protein
MRRYLVVANRTLGGGHLLAKVRECLVAGACEFHVLVPASHPTKDLTWTEGGDRAAAESRLAEAIARFRAVGASPSRPSATCSGASSSTRSSCRPCRRA